MTRRRPDRGHGAGPGPAPLPVLTLLVAALALLCAGHPAAESALVLDRAALAEGQVWRLLTGHLVHWSTDHLLWDVGTFAALGGACEIRSRRRFAACAIGSAIAISLSVWCCLPGLQRYGGLSGVDCALFALLATELWRERREAGRGAAGLALVLAAALVGKIGFEWATGGTLFVAELGPHVVPVPAAHVVGVAVGLAVPLLGAQVLRSGASRA